MRAVGIDVGGRRSRRGSWIRRAASSLASRFPRGRSAAELIVMGGGLGGERRFRERVAAVVRSSTEYPPHPPLEIVGSRLGPDAGIVGAALVTLDA